MCLPLSPFPYHIFHTPLFPSLHTPPFPSSPPFIFSSNSCIPSPPNSIFSSSANFHLSLPYQFPLPHYQFPLSFPYQCTPTRTPSYQPSQSLLHTELSHLLFFMRSQLHFSFLSLFFLSFFHPSLSLSLPLFFQPSISSSISFQFFHFHHPCSFFWPSIFLHPSLSQFCPLSPSICFSLCVSLLHLATMYGAGFCLDSGNVQVSAGRRPYRQHTPEHLVRQHARAEPVPHHRAVFQSPGPACSQSHKAADGALPRLCARVNVLSV